MIPYIRSLSELMAITESREREKSLSKKNEITSSTIDSGQRKRYIRSLDNKEVNLPNLPKKIRNKWIQNKDSVSRFIDELDYNNQIQSTYNITLLESQNKIDQQDVA
tara:strand:- start:250 stop:570 length:321 start_codon:yes stop_codon:yes gene_type:complete